MNTGKGSMRKGFHFPKACIRCGYKFPRKGKNNKVCKPCTSKAIKEGMLRGRKISNDYEYSERVTFTYDRACHDCDKTFVTDNPHASICQRCRVKTIINRSHGRKAMRKGFRHCKPCSACGKRFRPVGKTTKKCDDCCSQGRRK